MLVRAMTLDDCDALESLRHEAALGIDPRAELGGPMTRAWVVCDAKSGPALGYALCWWVVDELQILAFGVLPGARRRGVGRELLTQVLSAARAAGAARVTLEVGRHNLAAARLYAGAGFVVFNVRPQYYRKTREDALEMELSMSAAAGVS